MKRAAPLISKRTQRVLHILGKMIKSARLERNMSQKELAERLNVSRLTVISMEKGHSQVSIGTVFEAATILAISLFDDSELELNSTLQKVHQFTSLLPKRGGRHKKELDDDF